MSLDRVDARWASRFAALTNDETHGLRRFPTPAAYRQRSVDAAALPRAPASAVRAVLAQRDWHVRGQTGCQFARLAARTASGAQRRTDNEREPAASVLTQQFVLGIYGIRLVALYGLFVGGCTGPAGPAAAPTPTTPAPRSVPATTSAPPISPTGRVVTMRCSEVVARQQPAASDVVLGAVALPRRTTLYAGPSGENGWLVAKRGLDVRAEVAVELLVAPTAAGRARIGWGAGGRVGTHVRWPGCAPETGWLTFAGAYQVDAPMCVPLVVRSGGREAQVGVGVGVGCPPG